jgi:hypothetical protein
MRLVHEVIMEEARKQDWLEYDVNDDNDSNESEDKSEEESKEESKSGDSEE